MPENVEFCSECGTAMNTQSTSQQPTKNAPQTQSEISTFVKTTLPDILKKMLTEPIEGTKKILAEVKNPAQIGWLSVGTSIILILLFFYLSLPAFTKNAVDFNSTIKAVFLPVMCLGMIMLLSFMVKKINGSDKEFNHDALVGGLVGLIISIFFAVGFVESLFTPKGGFGLDLNSLLTQGILLSIVLILVFLLATNILLQSFRAAGIKEGVAFYLAPIILILSIYLGIKIWVVLFISTNNSLF